MPMTEQTRQRFEAEESAYWLQRDDLLTRYLGQWVAIVDGKVAAVGAHMNEVSAEATRITGSRVKFVALVGSEEIEMVVRTVQNGFYVTGPRHSLPMISGVVIGPNDTDSSADFVVDTGADITILDRHLADKLNLWDSPAATCLLRGLTGAAERRTLFDATIQLAGHSIEVTCDLRDDQPESILGRDVINQFALYACAKRDEIRFEWAD